MGGIVIIVVVALLAFALMCPWLWIAYAAIILAAGIVLSRF